jgi:hypothetical protein
LPQGPAAPRDAVLAELTTAVNHAKPGLTNNVSQMDITYVLVDDVIADPGLG